MECGLAMFMPAYGVAAVPIIPLPGITLANFASRHAQE